MCGRYTLVATEEQLIAEFELIAGEPFTPSRNICPTQPALVVRKIEPDGPKGLRHLRWGLIPPWSKDPGSAYKMINARSEEAAGKPAFREAWRYRRCLVPCTGFYEWKAIEGAPKSARKQAYEFCHDDHRVFALGGLWERWRGPSGDAIESFTILTRGADTLVAPIHDRMPVIIPRQQYDAWLDPQLTDATRVGEMLGAGSHTTHLTSLPVDVP